MNTMIIFFNSFSDAATSTQRHEPFVTTKITTQRSSPTSSLRSTANDDTDNHGLSGKVQVKTFVATDLRVH